MGSNNRATARAPKSAAAFGNVLKTGIPALLALVLAACGGGGGGGGGSAGGGGNVTPANQAGTVTIAGTATQNQILTATVADGNGVPATVAYQWMANGAAIAGATARTYGLTQAEVGKTITVKATYTDNNGYAEAPVSAATAAVADVNDAPAISFAPSGVSLLGKLSGSSRGMGIRRLASGQILISGVVNTGGDTGMDFMMERLNADGSLDSSFGSNGVVTTDFNKMSDSSTGHPVILADGRILLGGAATVNAADGTDFAVARYNPDGSLDTSFGQGGKVTIDFQHGLDRINKVLVQPDGRIIAMGGAYDATLKNLETAMVRLMPDGSLDPSFGIGGKLIGSFTVAGSSGEIEDAALMADGRIVVTGELGGSTFLARFMPTGAPDPGFMGGSYRNTNMITSYRLALAADGGVYVIGDRDIGSGNLEWIIAKYGSGGQLDPAFGTVGGEALMDFSPTPDVPMDIAMLGNGSLLIAGYADSEAYSGRYNMAMVKLTPAGQLDTSFGAGGRLVYDLSGSYDIAYGMDVAPDGRILLSGAIYNQDTASYEAAAGRLLPTGDPDTNFGQPIGRYMESQGAGMIVGGAHAVDIDVPAGGNYAGYTLKIQRSGGAKGSDVIAATGSVQFSSGRLLCNGLDVGSYANAGGALTLTFNAATTQSVLDQVVSSLAFSSTDVHDSGKLTFDWTLTDPQGLSGSAQSVFYIGDDFADVLDRQLTFYSIGTMYSPWQNNGMVLYAGSTSTTLATFSRWLTGSPSGLSEYNRANLLATRAYNSLNVKMLDLAEAQAVFANSARPPAYASGEFWTATGGGGQYAVINMGTGAVRYAASGTLSERHPGLFSVY